MAKKYKLVWPKDGPKGSRHRGFIGKFNDILTGRGPDIFLQREGSRTPINPDRWGNWDSYRDFGRHWTEQMNGARNPFFTSRGYRRYDPQTRKYRDWFVPEDWAGMGVDGYGIGPNGLGYPRFTNHDAKKMLRGYAQRRRVDPTSMGKEWHHDGPRRFQQEHDWFWQAAHRRSENARQGLPINDDINPNFRMHQEFPDDLPQWIYGEIL